MEFDFREALKTYETSEEKEAKNLLKRIIENIETCGLEDKITWTVKTTFDRVKIKFSFVAEETDEENVFYLKIEPGNNKYFRICTDESEARRIFFSVKWLLELDEHKIADVTDNSFTLVI